MREEVPVSDTDIVLTEDDETSKFEPLVLRKMLLAPDSENVLIVDAEVNAKFVPVQENVDPVAVIPTLATVPVAKKQLPVPVTVVPESVMARPLTAPLN